MPRSSRPRTRRIRATGAAFVISLASLTTVACGAGAGEEVVEQEMEEGGGEQEMGEEEDD